MPRRVYAGAWPRVRRSILERDGHICQIRAKGCTVTATDVDHIVPVSQGGAWYDAANLRAACGHCNTQRVGHSRSRRWQAGLTHITLVVGPPGADLLAYVRAHAQPSDLVVDHTAIARTLGNQPDAVTAVRTALIDRLRRAEVQVPRAWITSHNPQAETLYPHHHAITLGGPDQMTEAGAGPVKADDRVTLWHARRRGQHTTVQASRPW